MKRAFLFIAILLLSFFLKAQEHPIFYSQADRDRIVRLENRDENMQSQTNHQEVKFDSYFKWELGLILISIYGLIGFIIYDNRKILAPVENKIERIIKCLREAAEKDPVLREALKKTALW